MPRKKSQGKTPEARKHTPLSRGEPASAPIGRWWPIALIVGAGLFAYLNSFDGVFLFDDETHIERNEKIRHLLPIGPLLDTRRPVVTVSLAMNYLAGGTRVGGYHAFNLTVHILAALTLFGLVRRTAGRIDAEPAATATKPVGDARATALALAVALIWVAHPLQTQSVTYVIQRGESLMGLFYLLTLYCVLRGVDSPHRRRWHLVAVIACGLGMGSKAVMVTAPVVVLLYDRTFLTGSFRKALRRRYALYAGLAATWLVLVACGVVRGVLSPPTGGRATVGFGFQDISPLAYALTQPGVLLHYLKLSLWPHPLCLDYQWPVAETAWRIVPQAIVVLLLLGSSLWTFFRRSWAGFCGLFFFLILAPTSSFIPIKDVLFEHRMYLPLAAVVLVVVVGVDALAQASFARLARSPAPRRLVSGCLVAAVVLTLGVRTARRNEDYHSSLAIWSNVVRQQPHNARAHVNYGNALKAEAGVLKAQGDARRADQALDEAVAAYHLALDRRPQFPEAFYKLGVALYEQGRLDEAVAAQRQAVQLSPQRVEPHYYLGSILAALGRLDEAVTELRTALRIDPRHADAHGSLGVILGRMGQLDAAVTEFREAMALNPQRVEIQSNLALTLTRLGRLDEALEAYRAVLVLKPNHPQARRAVEAIKAQRLQMKRGD